MSEIKVKIAEEEALKKWDELVDISTQGSIFHKLDWLRAAEIQSKSKLFLLIGCRGEKIVGLFPVFYIRKPFLKMVFSPPPRCAIPWMGPVYIDSNLKQYKVESIQQEFVGNVFDFLENELGINIDYTLISTSHNLFDTRPFKWKGFCVQPTYSYVIPLDKNLDDILGDFKNQERTDIRRALKNDGIKIEKGGIKEILLINKMVAERYKKQGRKYGISDDYLRDLYRNFQADIEAITLYSDGRLITGLVLLRYKKRISHWIGGTPPRVPIIGANAVLHWKVIVEAKQNDLKYYELIGANTQHLCRVKSKFNPNLEVHFSATKNSLKGKVAEYLFRKLKGV